MLLEAQKNGKSTVKIKCEKKNDNASKGAVGNTNAHIKFKKTDCGASTFAPFILQLICAII